ncbi:MAG: prepilin peptidase [Candidatus Rokubacteria bacterium]|nr:prepilin peptidase [Candidatus Rokubacteria bacterium]
MPGLVIAIALGLLVGSFLNVVIARLPDGRSLWGPRSACPACAAPIAWYDNVPVLSYLALRARCRACAAPISARYPLVEIATAALFAAAWLRFGATPQSAVAALLLAALVAITVIDLDHQIIPDAITLPGIVAGLLANLAVPGGSWVSALIGMAIGGGLFLVIILVSGGGMGGGDMKLGAMLGAFLGWQLTLVAIFLAIVVGGVAGVALLAARRKGRKDAIPFGPFLAAGGVAALFCGERLVTWYWDAFNV